MISSDKNFPTDARQLRSYGATVPSDPELYDGALYNTPNCMVDRVST